MKLPWGLVADLITIYHDRWVSEKTIKAVEEYLQDSDASRNLYERYSLAGVELEGVIAEGPEKQMRHEFNHLAKKLRRRRSFYVGAISVYVIFSIAIYLYVLFEKLRDRNHI